MTAIVIPDVPETTWVRLRALASAHGRTPEAEARAILEDRLRVLSGEGWAPVNAICERLARSGRSFGDSAELVREDRQR